MLADANSISTIRPQPLEARKAALAKLLKRPAVGIPMVEHMEGDSAVIFEHACKLGFEGIVSKHRGHAYSIGAIQDLAQGQESAGGRAPVRGPGLKQQKAPSREAGA